MSGWFDHTVRRRTQLKRRVSPGAVAATTVVVLVTAAGGLVLGVGNAAIIPEALPVEAGMVNVFTTAASSCSALTPPRLAAQVMAETGFKATPEGGIAGLTAAEWKTWRPWSAAKPSDPEASLLALAHLTCDLVGRVRLTATVGDPWRLAVAASRTSAASVKSAGGVPAAAAEFMAQVDAHVAYYTVAPAFTTGMRPPALAGTGNSSTASAMPTVGSSPSATATPTLTSSQSPTQLPTPAPTSAPTYPAPPPTQAPLPPTQFTFGTFGSANGLRLNGSAAVAGGQLALASGLDKSASAWSTTRIDPSRSFMTSFAFNISKITDGIAFVIQGQIGHRAR